MWSKRNRIHDLQDLLARIEAATAVEAGLVSEILAQACPRQAILPRPSSDIARLIEAQAWVDLGFRLVACELPDWIIHRLSCDDRRWNCFICVRGLAINWVEDFAEFQHDDPALAILGALVQAQVTKAQGCAPSNITPFRRTPRTGPEPARSETERR